MPARSRIAHRIVAMERPQQSDAVSVEPAEEEVARGRMCLAGRNLLGRRDIAYVVMQDQQHHCQMAVDEMPEREVDMGTHTHRIRTGTTSCSRYTGRDYYRVNMDELRKPFSTGVKVADLTQPTSSYATFYRPTTVTAENTNAMALLRTFVHLYNLSQVARTDNKADDLTKILPTPAFKKHRDAVLVNCNF